MKNKKGNIMLNLMFFILGLGVLVAFISPINSFLNMAQNSQSLNCYGYIENGNVNDTLSFNSTLNGGTSGSPLACIALKLYLPYILLIFLIGGIAAVLSNRSENMFFGTDTQQQGY
jgi:hypothetical protein